MNSGGGGWWCFGAGVVVGTNLSMKCAEHTHHKTHSVRNSYLTT